MRKGSICHGYSAPLSLEKKKKFITQKLKSNEKKLSKTTSKKVVVSVNLVAHKLMAETLCQKEQHPKNPSIRFKYYNFLLQDTLSAKYLYQNTLTL
jgi:hypothetical protein